MKSSSEGGSAFSEDLFLAGDPENSLTHKLAYTKTKGFFN